MIKLIVTDIDGTLVGEGSAKLNPEYFDVIRKLTDQGILFAVASGRHSCSIKKVFEPVLDCIWILSQNGNVLERNGETIVLNPIPKEWVHEFWEQLSSIEKCDSILCNAKNTVCPFGGTQMYDIVKNNYKYDIFPTGGWDIIPDVECSMMTLFYPENVETFFKEHIYDRWKERLTLLISGTYWVDFLMKGVHKGAGIAYLQEKYQINKEEIIAFGDNLNDMKMLQAAGTSYAVSSARKEVQEIADHVIPDYKEDGVLHILKNISIL